MSLYAFIVPSYSQMLRGLSAQLDKGMAWAKAADVSEEAFLESRLAPDMKPLSDQVRFTCVHARGALTRLTGRESPELKNDGASLDGLKSMLNDTIQLFDQVSEADFDGADDRMIELSPPNGMTFDLTGFEYARDWSFAHFYFHAVTAYDIMRHRGVELSKTDYVSHMYAYLRKEQMAEAD